MILDYTVDTGYMPKTAQKAPTTSLNGDQTCLNKISIQKSPS